MTDPADMIWTRLNLYYGVTMDPKAAAVHVAELYRIEVRITFWEAKWRETGCIFDAPPKPKRMKGKRAGPIIIDDPYPK